MATRKKNNDNYAPLLVLGLMFAGTIGFSMTAKRAKATPANFSKYFDTSDLTVSQTATDQGINEQFNPPEWVYENARWLSENLLEPIYEYLQPRYGGELIITSWWRHPTTNSAVGGSSTSLHLDAFAVDLEYYINGQEQNIKIIEALVNAVPEWNEVVVTGSNPYAPNYIHIAAEPGNQINEVWHKPNGSYEAHNIWWLENTLLGRFN